MKENNKYFSWGRVILVCLITACTELMWTLYNTYVPIWLQAGNPAFEMGSDSVAIVGFGFGAFVTGIILTLDNIAGLFFSPVIGFLSDTTRSRFGRRKPWIIFTMPIMLIAFTLIPVIAMNIPAELNGKTAELTRYIVPFIGMLTVMLLAYAVVRTPANVIMYDITPSKHRSMASAIANFIGAGAGVAGAIVGAILFDINPGLPFWVAAGLSAVVISFVAVRITEPAIEEVEKEVNGEEKKKLSPKDTINKLRSLDSESKKSIIFMLLSVFFSYFAFGQLGSFSSSYGVSVLKMDVGTSGMIYAAGGSAFILGTLPAGYILKKLSRKKASIIGFIAFGLMGLVLYLFPIQAVVWPTIIVGALLWALVWVPQSPMIMDAVRDDSLLGSLEGVAAVARMLGYILGPMAGGFVVEYFGNNYSNIWLVVLIGSILGALTLIPVTRGEERDDEVQVSES